MNAKLLIKCLIRQSIVCMLVLLAAGMAHAGRVTISSSGGGSVSPDKLTILVGPDETVTLDATCDTNTVSVSYTESGDIGIDTDGDQMISPKHQKTRFKLGPTAPGTDCQIFATVSHTGSNSAGGPCLATSKPMTFHVKVIKLEIQEISFVGTGNYRITDQTSSYASESGSQFTWPEWSTTISPHPICYKVSSSPTVSIKVGITPDLGSLSRSVKIKATATQFSYSKTLEYPQMDLSLTSDHVSLNNLTTTDALSDKIDGDGGSYRIQFKVSFDNGSSFTDINDEKTSNDLYTTYGSPTGMITLKRLQLLTQIALSKSSEYDIVSAIGAYMTANSLFATATSLDDLGGNPWKILDGTHADCRSESTLMTYSLGLFGISGSSVVYVYPRHASWTGLEQAVFDGNETKPGSSGVKLIYYDPPTIGNNWEGCCKINGAYWMGGTGTSKTSAQDVLTYVAGARGSCSQRWSNDSSTLIDYPSGNP